MVLLCVPESRDALGILADYFNGTVSTIRYANGLFENITQTSSNIKN